MNRIGTTKDLQFEYSQTSDFDVCTSRGAGLSMTQDPWAEMLAVEKNSPC